MLGYYPKSQRVEARKFWTNSDPDSKTMNDICIWANQGRDPASTTHCWHNGTWIFVSYGLCSGSYLVAKAGDWILKTDNDQRTLTVMSDEAFCAEYGIIDAEYQVLAP